MLACVFLCLFAGIGTFLLLARPTVAAVTAVTEHVQANEGGENQYPNPVLRQPTHDYLLAK